MNASRNLASIVENSNGKIFRASFVKKDGSVRHLIGRLGVTKGLKGGKKTVSEDQYLTVYDLQKQGYRSVNKDSIIEVAFRGALHIAVK